MTPVPKQKFRARKSTTYAFAARVKHTDTSTTQEHYADGDGRVPWYGSSEVR